MSCTMLCLEFLFRSLFTLLGGHLPFHTEVRGLCMHLRCEACVAYRHLSISLVLADFYLGELFGPQVSASLRSLLSQMEVVQL